MKQQYRIRSLILIGIGSLAMFGASDARADTHISAGVDIDIDAVVEFGFDASMVAGILLSDPAPAPPPVYYEPPVYVPVPPPAPVYRAIPVVPAQSRPYRWGIGIFGGSLSGARETIDSEAGLLLQFHMTPKFSLEGELTSSEASDNEAVTQFRSGGSLLYHFSPGQQFTPFVLGGMGIVDSGDELYIGGYGEVGAGARLSFGRFDFLVDVRTGMVGLTGGDHWEARTGGKQSGVVEYREEETTEGYTRVRFAGLFRF